MIDSCLDDLPTLKDFKELKKGDSVYSGQYGIGKVHSLHSRDEVIVQFSDIRERLAIYDGIRRIPETYLHCPGNSKVQVVCDGKSMSFAQLKKKNKAERKLARMNKKILND